MPGGSSYRYNPDGLRVAITDSTQSVTDWIEYAPFGTITYRSGSTDTPFLFNGEAGVQTEANGLYYMRARFYHARLMRFVNADPIGFSGGLNWYAFGSNNPVINLDPLGLREISLTGGYGLAGSFSIGNNSGQWNWSAAFGFGIGLSVDVNPGDNKAGYTGEKSEASLSLVGTAQIGIPQVVEFGGTAHGGISAFGAATDDGDVTTTFAGSSVTGSAGNAFFGTVSTTRQLGARITQDRVDPVDDTSFSWSLQGGGAAMIGFKIGRVYEPKDKVEVTRLGEMEILKYGAKPNPKK